MVVVDDTAGTMTQSVDCVVLVYVGLSEVQMYETKTTPKRHQNAQMAAESSE